MEYNIQNSNELTHWGIKGMRWGVRRYQNKDGSLTAAGKKKRAAEEAKLKEREQAIKGREKARASQAKLDAKKAELDAREKALKKPYKTEPNKPATKQKTIRELSDDELRARIDRMILEKQYYDTRKNLIAANPKQVSTGKRFLNSALNDVIVPAAKEAGKEVGKKWIIKFMGKKLNLDDNAAKSLAPEVKTWEDMIKKQTWEKNERDYAAEKKQHEQETKEIKSQRDELNKQQKEFEKQRKELEKERKKLERERNRTEQGGN